jgi:protein SCO1
MRAMASLQARIEREEQVRRRPLDVRLVSITVDPTNDTPEVLRATALEYGADFERWTLLTGEEAAIRALVVGGLMTEMGEAELDPASANLIHISHSSRLVLVDPFGRIRGYYDTDALGLDEVFHRATHVLRVREEEAEALQASRGRR